MTEKKLLSKDLKKYATSNEFKENMNEMIAINLEQMERTAKVFDRVCLKSLNIGKGYFFKTKWSP